MPGRAGTLEHRGAGSVPHGIPRSAFGDGSSRALIPEACETCWWIKLYFLRIGRGGDPPCGVHARTCPARVAESGISSSLGLVLRRGPSPGHRLRSRSPRGESAAAKFEGATAASALGLSCYAKVIRVPSHRASSRHGFARCGDCGRGAADAAGWSGASPARRRGLILSGRASCRGARSSCGWMPASCLRAAIPWCSIALWPARCWAISWGQLAAGPLSAGLFSSMLWGEMLFPDRYSITEDPPAPGLASASFDNDAVATAPKAFVAEGRLDSYALSVYAGRRLGLAPHGQWRWRAQPRNESRWLSPRGAAPGAGHGLWITELMGQGQVTAGVR